MIFGLLVSLFVFICFVLILLILIQKGSSSMGIGNLGGSNLMLFGGSGAQDFLQKITWTLGAIFMAGSLVLAIMKTHDVRSSRYIEKGKAPMMRMQPTVPAPIQAPTPEPTETE